MKLDNILNESREWRRIDVDLAAKGKMTTGKSFESRVVNINPDGVCFVVPQGVAAGQEVRLVMELPAIGKMEARVKISWAGYLEQYKHVRAGGKFEDLPEKEKEKFLRYYHLKVMSSMGG
ncbi:MAG: PilZ domain-containing protein [Candidatus Omnitrophota bacterium]